MFASSVPAHRPEVTLADTPLTVGVLRTPAQTLVPVIVGVAEEIIIIVIISIVIIVIMIKVVVPSSSESSVFHHVLECLVSVINSIRRFSPCHAYRGPANEPCCYAHPDRLLREALLLDVLRGGGEGGPVLGPVPCGGEGCRSARKVVGRYTVTFGWEFVRACCSCTRSCLRWNNKTSSSNWCSFRS